MNLKEILIGVDKKIKLCVCNDQYGTLSFDNKPCTRKRITQATAFWLQIFFGWIQVGAFMLHWWWYALSVLLHVEYFVVVLVFACVMILKMILIINQKLLILVIHV